jgi:hypothetical protein
MIVRQSGGKVTKDEVRSVLKIVANTGRYFDSNLGYDVSCAQLYQRCKDSESSHIHILITIQQIKL